MDKSVPYHGINQFSRVYQKSWLINEIKWNFIIGELENDKKQKDKV